MATADGLELSVMLADERKHADALAGDLERIERHEYPVRGLADGMYGHAAFIAGNALQAHRERRAAGASGEDT